MKNTTIAILFTILSLACSSNKENTAVESKQPDMKSAMENNNHYKPEMVVNTTDFACGMPVSAGISDTCHFEEKAYGFCSPECKVEFQKEPTKYLAAKQ